MRMPEEHESRARYPDASCERRRGLEHGLLVLEPQDPGRVARIEQSPEGAVGPDPAAGLKSAYADCEPLAPVAASSVPVDGSRKVQVGEKLELNLVNAVSFLPPTFTSPIRKIVDVALTHDRVALLAELRTTLVSAPLLLTLAKMPSRRPATFLPPRVSLLAP